MRPNVILVSNVTQSGFWLDNVREEDVDYSHFLYDANQYADDYCTHLTDRDSRLHEIIHNAIVKPNLVRVNGANMVMDLVSFYNNYKNIQVKTMREAHLNGVYLQYYLKKNGIACNLINDFCIDSNHENILANSTDVTAFILSTTFIVDWEIVVNVCKFVKAILPDVPIVIGGPLVYLLRDLDEETRHSLLTKVMEYVDYMIVEQNGEESLKNLILHLKNKLDPTAIGNIILKSNVGISFTGFRPEASNFKNFIINWDEVDLPDYINTVPIETSRGCPFRCNFCSYSQFHTYELKPVENLLKEISSLKRCRNIKYISFVDGSLNAIPERIKNICRGMIDIGADFKWNFMGNVKGMDLEQAELMHESGCEIANIGVESGNSALRSKMNKPIESNDEILNAFSYLNQSGIIGRGFFFVGYPGETSETVEDTIKLINDSSMDLCRLAIFRPRLNSNICRAQHEQNQGLQGRGYLWAHNSCDSLTASRFIVKMVKEIRPIYDPGRGVYELMQCGVPKETALKINALKNQNTQLLLQHRQDEIAQIDAAIRETI